MSAKRSNAWDRLPEKPAAVTPLPFGAGRVPTSRRRTRRFTGLLIALVVSALFHATVVTTAYVWQVLHAPKQDDSAQEIEIVDASKFPNFRMPKIDSPAMSVPTPPPPVNAKGQIVALSKADASAVAPKDAHFLSDENHTTNEETRARDTAVAPKVLAEQFKGLGEDPKVGQGAAQGTDSGRGESLGRDATTEDATNGKATSDGNDAKDHRLALAEDEFHIRARPLPTPEGGVMGDSDHDAHTLAAGAGTKVAMAGAPNNDYLPGVRITDKTVLNSKQDFFASFWNRVNAQVGPVWASLVNSIIPSEHLLTREYHTIVTVTLTPKGDLVGVEIVRSCGVSEWDQAVLLAFQKAAPFLHPPPGMIDDDGQIHMDHLEFVVNLERGQVVHMYADPRASKLFPGIGEGVPMR